MTSILAPPPIALKTDHSRVEVLDPKETNDSSDEDEDLAQPPQAQTASPFAVGRKAADDDGPTAEDADAAEALDIFLQGKEPNKATPHQLLHLAQSIVPHSWGSIKLDLSKLLLNLMSVLFARTVLREAE